MIRPRRPESVPAPQGPRRWRTPVPRGRPRAALWLAALLAVGALATAARADDDPLLSAARRYVEQSDRYLHHSKLHRGMKGYGLTVMAGTKIVRFNAEIVSVVPQWAPHRVVILAMLSGQDLETAGVISGMSGSPIFVRDGDKDKLIGALAYGWRGQKRPLCGVQPITQMLAVGGVLKDIAPPKGAGKAAGSAIGEREFLRVVLDPRKGDFSALGRPAGADRGGAVWDAGPQLVPLSTPLMVSGLSRPGLQRLTDDLAPMGIVPVQAGGAGQVQAEAARTTKLEPGAALAVALVTGDLDFSAVGTVTDVIGDHVLAFGHSMTGDGEVSVPIGTAYVHTVVAGLFGSFKLSSGMRVTGSLERDEETGVFGRVGARPEMIPMTVTVEWQGTDRRRVYHYQVAAYRWMASRMVGMLITESATAWRAAPEHHTVRHIVEIDFAGLGRYRASNVSTDSDASDAYSDAVRPISAIQNNPFGQPAKIQRVNVHLVIEPTNRYARIEDFKLDGQAYRPGETVSGVVTVQPYRKPRRQIRMGLQLPADMPEGTYTLTVCDDVTSISALQRQMPQRFSPKTVQDLFESIQRVVDSDAGRLYMRVPLPHGGGLAVERKELPDLPDSRAKILAEAEPQDTQAFSAALTRSMGTEFVLRGSAQASFQVSDKPREMLLRQKTR